MKNHKYADRQFQLLLMRAQWQMASAMSGYYKQRAVYHGSPSDEGNRLTDEELLAETMGAAQRHMELAFYQSEAMAGAEEDDNISSVELVDRRNAYLEGRR